MPEQLSGIGERMTAIGEISKGKELEMALERKIGKEELQGMLRDFVENDFDYSAPIAFKNEVSEKDPKGLLGKNLGVIEGLKGTNIKPEEFIEKACAMAICRARDLSFDEEDICQRFKNHYGIMIALKDMGPENKQEIKKAMEIRLESFIKDHIRSSEKANPEYPLGIIKDLIESGIMDEGDKDKFFQMAMNVLCSTHRDAISKERKK